MPLLTACFLVYGWRAAGEWCLYTLANLILLNHRGREFAPDVHTFPRHRENLLRGQLPEYRSYSGNLNCHNIRRYLQLISVLLPDSLTGSQTSSALQRLCEHHTIVV
jgi:hypothetical protein